MPVNNSGGGNDGESGGGNDGGVRDGDVTGDNCGVDDNIVEATINEEEPDNEELDDFKNKIKEYCKLDDQIRKLQIAVKERKTAKNALTKYISEFMFKYDYYDINCDNSKIQARKKECVAPIKINEVKEKILQNSNLSGEELLKIIFDPESRAKYTKEKISRKIPNITSSLRNLQL